MAGQARGDKESAISAGAEGIIVPVSAVFSKDGKKEKFIWVIDEKSGQVSMRKVATGKLSDSGIMIDKGLSPGEWVAIAGVHSLKEGQKVRIAQ